MSPLKTLSTARIAISLILVIAALAAALFLPAGRLDWPEAWVFIAAYGAYLALYALWALRRDPAQLLERGRVAPNVKRWDKVIMGLYSLLLLGTLLLTGLDAGRFRWSSMPVVIKAIGWLGLVLAGSIIFWVMTTNTYASRLSRVQGDRGQEVVTSGPYRYVRHPMYLGIIVLFLSLPLALGSLWGLIPGALIGVLYGLRTALEDRMLKEELAGYEAYAERVRYRLVPGIW
jgi:protein-S-isoprenylcysteine O-methyltransferase Ste14